MDRLTSTLVVLLTAVVIVFMVETLVKYTKRRQETEVDRWLSEVGLKEHRNLFRQKGLIIFITTLHNFCWKNRQLKSFLQNL